MIPQPAERSAVGVLVFGGGQSINFAVRIEKVCAKLRRC